MRNRAITRPMKRALKIGAAVAAIVTAGAASAQQPGPAEANTRAALVRIQQLNPAIGAVLAVDPTAVDQAKRVDAQGMRGPLAGQPVLLKDNIEAAGPLPTTAGSLALANNVTNRDAPLVARLRAAGAVILGKANLAEWARARSIKRFQGWSAVGGQVRNPYALDRATCGSSSGSAVAVATGLVRIAIGTDTTGSITCPSSVNGVVGMRPTLGLVSRRFIVPISRYHDTPGPIAATVREAAVALTVMAGSDPADPSTIEADRRRGDYARGLSLTALKGVRIGVMRFGSAPGSEEAFEA